MAKHLTNKTTIQNHSEGTKQTASFNIWSSSRFPLGIWTLSKQLNWTQSVSNWFKLGWRIRVDFGRKMNSKWVFLVEITYWQAWMVDLSKVNCLNSFYCNPSLSKSLKIERIWVRHISNIWNHFFLSFRSVFHFLWPLGFFKIIYIQKNRSNKIFYTF